MGIGIWFRLWLGRILSRGETDGADGIVLRQAQDER